MQNKMTAAMKDRPDFIPKIEYISVDLLEPNEGQYSNIDEETNKQVGLGRNPRWIRDSRFESLKKSITDDPEYLLYHPLEIFTLSHIKGKDGKYIVVGGNQRLAACKELGFEEVPCVVFLPDTPFEKLRAYAIKSNEAYGQNDYDILSGNEWNLEELQDWGMELDYIAPGEGDNWDDMDDPEAGEKKEVLTKEELRELIGKASEGSIVDYNEDTDYDLTQLFRTKAEKASEMLANAIDKKEIRPEIADLCRTRIAQCSIINFDQVIKYYRSEDSTPAERELLKRLYLVFITPKEAVESGMLKIVAETGKIFDQEIASGSEELDDDFMEE